ncbi:MAG: SCO family protein [Hydrogenophilales bacterium]|nr:SCO family protein [Hydrogenophilales bacterium]
MRWLAALLSLVMLSACSKSQPIDFRGTDITGAVFGKDLQLTDHNGQARTLKDFKGKLVVLFFGYTHCPDVCPTTLSDTASALRQLTPDEAGRIQVLFVTIDPARDSAALLRQYVPYFHPSFLGLRGTAEQVAAAAGEFRVFYRKHQEPGVDGYSVDHTAGSYVLDASGKLRLLLPFALPAEDIAHDLRRLLSEAGR